MNNTKMTDSAYAAAQRSRMVDVAYDRDHAGFAPMSSELSKTSDEALRGEATWDFRP